MIRVLESINPYEDYFKKHDIKQKSNCTGFSEKEQKWYGFSHRAIYGFGVGDVCKGDIGLGDGYTFKAGDKLKTLDDCKKRAEDYANAVD